MKKIKSDLPFGDNKEKWTADLEVESLSSVCKSSK